MNNPNIVILLSEKEKVNVNNDRLGEKMELCPIISVKMIPEKVFNKPPI